MGGARGNEEFHFRARVNFTPNHQLAPDQFGAFPHAEQAVVSPGALSRQNYCRPACGRPSWELCLRCSKPGRS